MLAQSVRQRLYNYARAQQRPFEEVLLYFALERFLYRLSCSPYRDRFILKGGLMLTTWSLPASRPTRDIDLLGRMANSVEKIVAIVRSLCALSVPEDGLHFDADSVRGEPIIEAAQYHGVRVKLLAYLGKSRVHLQLDIGFGDPLHPQAQLIQMPTLLDFPPPVLYGYSKESLIAEKSQVMLQLGEINSRLKDFYDLWALFSSLDFDGETVAAAVRATFTHRGTPITPSSVIFTPAFAAVPSRQRQWLVFLRRIGVEETAPTFPQAMACITAFLQPMLEMLAEGKSFQAHWPPGGPWISILMQEEGGTNDPICPRRS